MRASATDLMQGFRYHVITSDIKGNDLLQKTRKRDRDGYSAVEAGFQSVTVPEISVEASEYREGIMKYTQKYPGPPTVSELSLIRGITKHDTDFYNMVMASIEGEEYRVDVTILHYQRAEMSEAITGEPSKGIRRINCKEAFAIRAKTSGDLDSMSGDVSLAEVDLAIEEFDVTYG